MSKYYIADLLLKSQGEHSIAKYPFKVDKKSMKMKVDTFEKKMSKLLKTEVTLLSMIPVNRNGKNQ